jgi:hypothetical protein
MRPAGHKTPPQWDTIIRLLPATPSTGCGAEESGHGPFDKTHLICLGILGPEERWQLFARQ